MRRSVACREHTRSRRWDAVAEGSPEIGKAPRPAGPRGLSVASRKPDPVVGDHPSGTHVAVRLMRPKPGSLGRATLKRSPIWSCTGRGLPSRPVTRTAGELLPHRFTLTRTPRKGPLAVCSLLRFPSGFPGWPLASALLCGVRTFLDGRLAGFEKLRDAAPPRPPGLPKKCTTGVGSSDAPSYRAPPAPSECDERRGSAHDEDEDGDDAGEAADPCQCPHPRVTLVLRPLVGVGELRGREVGLQRPPPTHADWASETPCRPGRVSGVLAPIRS